ncbi:hypothetical protein PACTADRAFT_50773 [Pachysolen tannophilus NRRL Y-2460]|uniref:Nuclear mRNA export factor n=1 Tax=Pachysolen tannophilus NRRL Y-2460 TaxID=669874 RepID=A0A1E4TT58_PACTA|nr:hypothetical protein PACTADRAFT_50773 [Pachysolen tannophilus NRRL Y-2460]
MASNNLGARTNRNSGNTNVAGNRGGGQFGNGNVNGGAENIQKKRAGNDLKNRKATGNPNNTHGSHNKTYIRNKNNTGKSDKGRGKDGTQNQDQNQNQNQNYGDVPITQSSTITGKVQDFYSGARSGGSRDKVYLPIPSTVEDQFIGPLIQNPENLGYIKIQHEQQELPPYLVSEEKILEPSKFEPDEWDIANQHKMLELETQVTDLQKLEEEYDKMREIERKEMENRNLVDKADERKNLFFAITFKGTCLYMCPTYERIKRSLNNYSQYELDPISKKVTINTAIKMFSRSEAGQAPQLPSDVRPPHILVQTLDYMIDKIVDKLPEAESFIWNRTRSIRQDFTYQNYAGPEAIYCIEKICRMHLITLHIMAGSNVEYSQQQQLEQLNKSLETLNEIYDDVRRKGGKCKNEAEFRSYYLLSYYKKPELDHLAQSLPDDIFHDPFVQKALMFRGLLSQNNRDSENYPGCLNFFVEFFKIVNNPEIPVLMTCLLEVHFNEVRFYALKSMSSCFHTSGKPYYALQLKEMLGFNSEEELVKFVEYYDLGVSEENGKTCISFHPFKYQFVKDKEKYPQAYSLRTNEKISSTQNIKFLINDGIESVDFNIFANRGNRNNFNNNNNVSIGSNNFGKNSVLPSSTLLGRTQSVSQNYSAMPSANTEFSRDISMASPSSTQNNEIQKSQFKVQQPKAEPQQSNKFTSDNILSMKAQPTVFKAQESKPNFQFQSFNESAKPSNNVPNEVKGEYSVPQFSLQTEKGYAVPIFQNNIKPKSETATQSLETPPIKTPAQLMKNSSKYKTAILGIYTEMLSKLLTVEMNAILNSLISERQRSNLINDLSQELYSAFMSEVLYITLLEVKAENFRKRSLKLKLIRVIMPIAKRCKDITDTKNRRRQEFDSFQNSLGGVNTSSISLSRKRQFPHEISFNNSVILNKKFKRTVNNEDSFHSGDILQSEGIFSPIDMNSVFLQAISTKIKCNIKILILLKDWCSIFSQWLIRVLSLQKNEHDETFQKLIQNDKVEIKLAGLPHKFNEEQSFKDVSCLIFQFGVTEKDDNVSIKTKLNSDGKVLAKVTEYIKKYCKFKVSILILYYDYSNSNISLKEVNELLKLSQYNSVTYSNYISSISICDMALYRNNGIPGVIEGENSLQKLTNGLSKLAHNVNEELNPKNAESIQQQSLNIGKFDQTQHHLLSGLSSNISSVQMERELMKKYKLEEKRRKRISFIRSRFIPNSPSLDLKSLSPKRIWLNSANASVKSEAPESLISVDNRKSEKNSCVNNSKLFLTSTPLRAAYERHHPIFKGDSNHKSSLSGFPLQPSTTIESQATELRKLAASVLRKSRKSEH